MTENDRGADDRLDLGSLPAALSQLRGPLLVRAVWAFVIGIGVVVGLIVNIEEIISWCEPAPPEEILIGLSKEQIRSRNSVREMLEGEDGATIASVRGVFGFLNVNDVMVMKAMPSTRATTKLNKEQDPLVNCLEVHVNAQQRMMLLVYVSESGASRLGTLKERERFLAACARRTAYQHLVGVPMSRVKYWAWRSLWDVELRVE